MKNKKNIIISFLLTFFILSSYNTIHADNTQNYDIITDSPEAYNSIVKSTNNNVSYSIPQIGFIHTQITNTQAQNFAAMPQTIVSQTNTDDSTTVSTKKTNTNQGSYNYWPIQWDMKKVTDNGNDYQYMINNDKVTVGLVDSGIDLNHPSLKNSIIRSGSMNLVPKNGDNGQEKNETGNPNDIQDKIGHGTEVAGQITSTYNIKGVYPGVKLHIYRVLGAQGSKPEWIMKGIVDSADNNDAVINVSMGKYLLDNQDPQNKAEFKAWKKTISYAYRKGSIIVASAGEDSLNEDNESALINHYMQLNKLTSIRGKVYDVPCHFKNVVSVGSTGPNDNISNFSNYGYKIQMYAPGGDTSLYSQYGPDKWNALDLNDKDLIATTYLNGQYTYTYGTSFAAPKVTGIIASFIAKYGWYDCPHQVVKYIERKTPRNNNGLRIISANILKDN